MVRFMIKASEYKNVCKSVNNSKLAELKKEIIEILKKQDEKEFKKAIDYFESQELHYTHLEKSLTGKWIEKAGYGIGTVRIWKGKKYKKIAPGKWARVFDKEGRGTNIAIGKLIAKVQKIDNVEDLMAFVMANKQRFVDEQGFDLPVLDKLRAAVDARNGNVGSKEKTVEDKIKENPDYPFKPKTDKERAERAAFEKDRDDFIERMDKIRQENKKKEAALKAAKKEEPSDGSKGRIKIAEEKLKIIKQEIDEITSKPAEKEDYKIAQSGKLATQKQVDYATKVSDKYSLTREEMLKKPITAIQKYANSIVEDFDGGIDKFIEYMADGRSEGVSLDEVGKEFGKLINHNIARKIWKDYDSGALEVNNDGFFEPKKETKEPIMNHPEALKGIDFVNKNKMHVLANFLANHDKVNMATAVVRLQNAYERLGEEKFLAYFPKDVVERYRKESGKEETKQANRRLNEEFLKTLKGPGADKAIERVAENIDTQIKTLTDDNLSGVYAKLTMNLDKYLDKKTLSLDSVIDKKSGATLKSAYMHTELAKRHPEVVKKVKEELEKRGISVKKSLFDDFIVDVFEVDEEEELGDELYDGETEYNDYSAEQPELFNYTEMMVREALNRRFKCN